MFLATPDAQGGADNSAVSIVVEIVQKTRITSGLLIYMRCRTIGELGMFTCDVFNKSCFRDLLN